MNDEELRRKRDAALAPLNYDGWSVSDFEAHLEALRTEIDRAAAARAAKQAALDAAAAFFKTPG